MENIIKKYQLYNRGKRLAILVEDYTKRPMQMHMEVDLSLEPIFIPRSFPPLMDENGFISHKNVVFWMSFRVPPPTQEGIEDVLRDWGLSEYSPLALFHVVKGHSSRDTMYVEEIE